MTKTIETFRDVTRENESMRQDHPSCHNRTVRVVKYRVTVEVIEVPIEMIQQRIQALWDENENHHNYGPLSVIAEKYGMVLE